MINGISPHLFFALPDDIHRSVLFPFFSQQDMGRLDVAISNHALRNWLIHHIYPALQLPCPINSFEFNGGGISWFHKRHIPLTSVIFTNESMSAGVITAIMQLMNDVEPNLTTIDLQMCEQASNTTAIVAMAQRCPSLTTLDLRGYDTPLW
jgi:hypothetical protein